MCSFFFFFFVFRLCPFWWFRSVKSITTLISLQLEEDYHRVAPPGEALLPAIRPEDVGKKCLILDLDETLVHSSFKVFDCSFRFENRFNRAMARSPPNNDITAYIYFFLRIIRL
jgi:hypothetical protein